MSSRTQIRLAQLTGSLIQNKAGEAALDAASLQDNLDHLATAIKNITGDDYHNTSDGVISGDLEIKGNLTVSGGTSTLYVSSSVFEFQDPLIVGNALSGSAQLRPSASFGHGNPVVENPADNQYDYGLVFKRSLRINPPPNDYQLESAVDYNSSQLSNAEKYSFGVFKLDGGSGVNAGEKKSFAFDANSGDVRNGVAYGDLLNMAKGHYALLSGSGGKGLALVISASNSSVEVQALGTNESYSGHNLNDDAYNPTSISLLSAYAGTIFDRQDNQLHVAAAALTGSADNEFISGSANVLAYGSVASAGFEVFTNDILSGSYSVGKLMGQYDSNNNPQLVVKAPQGAGGSDVQLLLSASGGVFFEAGGAEIKLPTADGSLNQVLVTDGSGVLSFANVPTSTTANKAVLKVRQTLAAATNLVVTASSTLADSTDFELIDNGLTGSVNLALQDIPASDLSKKLDVFVNGQLLVSGASGSPANAVSTDADYRFVSADADGRTQLEFAFDLEADDILTLITK